MKNLAPDETVYVDVRPHWWFLAGPVALLALFIIGAIAALVDGVPGWTHWLIVGALVGAAGWLVARYMRWRTTRLLVTSSRIMERRGILGRSGREIPLSALTDIGYRQSIFERIIRCGDVVIESAGRDGQEVFTDLPHPQDIHNEIYAHLPGRSGPAPAAPNIPQQIDQLDQLRRRGVISEAEFEAKKAQLLERM
jgi:membrane protein YdbS with pleckstrin-like domain